MSYLETDSIYSLSRYVFQGPYQDTSVSSNFVVPGLYENYYQRYHISVTNINECSIDYLIILFTSLGELWDHYTILIKILFVFKAQQCYYYKAYNNIAMSEMKCI